MRERAGVRARALLTARHARVLASSTVYGRTELRSKSAEIALADNAVVDVDTRWCAVLTLLVELFDNDGELPPIPGHLLESVASDFDVSGSTLRRWLDRVWEGDGSLVRRPGSGAPESVYHDVNQSLHNVFDVYGGKHPHRVFYHLVNIERLAAGESAVSLQTVQRVLASDYWAAGRAITRPELSELTCLRRLDYCHSKQHVNFTTHSSKLYCHTDEKWVLQYGTNKSFYCPTHLKEKIEIEQRLFKNPVAIPKVMFVAFVSPPIVDNRGQIVHNGKIGAYPAVEWETRTDNRSPIYKLGQQRPIPENINAANYKTKYLGTLFYEDLVKVLLLCTWLVLVELQIDGAGGHGIGNAADFGAKRAAEFSDYLNDKLSRDQRLRGRKVHVDVRVQPASSPDFNWLDIAVWASLVAGFALTRVAAANKVQSVEHRIIDAFADRWTKWDSICKMPGVLRVYANTMVECIKVNGSNNFKVPHSKDGVPKVNTPSYTPLPLNKTYSPSYEHAAVQARLARDGVSVSARVSTSSQSNSSRAIMTSSSSLPPSSIGSLLPTWMTKWW